MRDECFAAGLFYYIDYRFHGWIEIVFADEEGAVWIGEVMAVPHDAVVPGVLICDYLFVLGIFCDILPEVFAWVIVFGCIKIFGLCVGRETNIVFY